MLGMAYPLLVWAGFACMYLPQSNTFNTDFNQKGEFAWKSIFSTELQSSAESQATTESENQYQDSLTHGLNSKALILVQMR